MQLYHLLKLHKQTHTYKQCMKKLHAEYACDVTYIKHCVLETSLVVKEIYLLIVLNR